MSEESAASPVPLAARRRLLRRIYPSTWLAMLLAAGAMIFVEFPGYRRSYQGVDSFTYWHGWPCVWLANFSFEPDGTRSPWSLGSAGVGRGFILWSLVVDVALSLMGVAVVAWAFQKWRSKRGSLLRYRLRTLLLFFAVVALLNAPIAAWHREWASERDVIEGVQRDCGAARWYVAAPNVVAVPQGRMGVDVGTVWKPPNSLPDSLATITPFRQLFDRAERIEVGSEHPLTATTVGRLSELSCLTSLRLWQGSVSGNAFKLLCRIHSLRSLVIGQAMFSDGDIDQLPALSNLEDLELWRTRISDAGLASIAQLANLRHLSLDSELLTGIGLSELASLRHLSELKLSGRALTDDGIATIKGFPSLKLLSLYGESLRNARIRCDVPKLELTCRMDLLCIDLREAPALESMSARRVDPANRLKAQPRIRLGNIDHLGSLYLQGLALDELTMATIMKAPVLNELQLDDVQLIDGARIDARRISELKQLRYLSLKGAALSDDDLSSLCLLSNLQSLDISGCNIVGKGLVELQKLPSLTTLWLTRTPVSDEAVASLKAGNPRLTTVYFEPKAPVVQDLSQQVALVRNELTKVIECKTSPWKLADGDFACLEGLANLDKLDLSETFLTDAGLEHLKRLPRLRELILCRTQVTDAAVRTLKEMPALVHVDIEGTRITDEGRRALGKLVRNAKAERN